MSDIPHPEHGAETRTADPNWRVGAIWRMAIRRDLPDEWVEARLIEHLGQRVGSAISRIWLTRRPIFVHREDRDNYDLAVSRAESERHLAQRAQSVLDSRDPVALLAEADRHLAEAESHVARRAESVMDRGRADWREHLEQERLRRAEEAGPEPSP